MSLIPSLGFNSMVAICAIVVALAYYFSKDKDVALQESIHQILKSMIDIESNYTVDSAMRVAVGYGGCLEMVVNASHINMINKNDSLSPKHHEYVSSEKELRELFMYFLRHGASAEGYISDIGLFKKLYKEVTQLGTAKMVLGCSAPVMASIFANEGIEVLLGVQSGPKLSSLLPTGVTVSDSELQEEDDVHLVFEYHKGMKLVHYEAPRNNRVTFHNDKNNPTIGSLKGLQEKMQSFKTNLLVVGGFQAMDNFPIEEDVQLERINAIQQHLTSQQPATLIHTGIPSFNDEKLLVHFTENLVPHSDSITISQQDLPVIWSLIMHNNISGAPSTSLKMPVFLDYMRDIIDSERKLSRLHVHTLKYQVIMTAKGSQWKNNKGAVTKAALIANEHVCGPFHAATAKSNTTYTFKFGSFNSTASGNVEKAVFTEEDPVWCGNDDKVEVCVAPVVMCEQSHDIRGVYDYVMAAGLVLQI